MKNNFKKRIISFLLCAVMISAPVWALPAHGATVSDATVQSYEDKINSLSAKQEEILQKLGQMENSLATAMARKAEIDILIELTARKMQTAEAMIYELEVQIAEKEAKIIETEEKEKDQRKIFLERIATQHKIGNASYIELLFGSENISDLLLKSDAINVMMEYDKKVILDLKKSQDFLENTRDDLAASKLTQNETLKALENEQSSYTTLAKESEYVINQLYSDQNAWQAEYNAAVQAEAELDEKLQAYIKEQQEANQTKPNPPEQYVDGAFGWPIAVGNGVYSYISSHFGWRVLNGGSDYHAATDIAVAHGTPILASNGGVVIVSEFHYSYGNYVLIDHGNGISTLYAHQSQIAVHVGQTVSRGEVIGYVGNTGYSFGAHLHFEYRIYGERVDPELYVPSPY